jgi:hypothetical protein
MPNLQDKLDKAARAVEPILWNILDEIENDKGDWVCTITGEVMDDFGNIIDEGSGDWVTDYEDENDK